MEMLHDPGQSTDRATSATLSGVDVARWPREAKACNLMIA